MRTQVTRVFPETALERILDALEHELIEASDAEILAAASDLGMQPHMKGSAAFLGLRYSAALRAAGCLDPQWLAQVLNDPRRVWLASAAPSREAQPRRAPPSRGSARRQTGSRKSPRPPKEPGES